MKVGEFCNEVNKYMGYNGSLASEKTIKYTKLHAHAISKFAQEIWLLK